MKKNIALLFGGKGHEHEVSLRGALSLRSHFNPEKYKITDVFIDLGGNFFIINADGEKYPTFPVKMLGKSGFLLRNTLFAPDAVFPLLHGDFGEDGRIQGLLECAELPFIGEDTRVGALTADKAFTKAVAERLKIPTAKHLVFRGASAEDAEMQVSSSIGYPVFVKPTGLGSSVGAGSAHTKEEFISAYNRAKINGSVIVEELVGDKRELEVAYLNFFGKRTVTPPSEILCSGTYGYTEKYKLGTKTKTVASVPFEISELAKEYALRLVSEIGIFSIARIDFFYSHGVLLFNEINTLPGFTEDSMYLKMLKAAGIPEDAVIDALTERAGERL